MDDVQYLVCPSCCVRSPSPDTGAVLIFTHSMPPQELLHHGQFEAQGVSMVLTACAHLNYRTTPLMEAAAAAALQTMPDATPQGVANCAWAMAKLNFTSVEVCSLSWSTGPRCDM